MIKVIDRCNGIDTISLKNDYIEVVVSNYGCTILKILVKDKNRIERDVVLGYGSIDDYAAKSGTYMGAIVGRVANRIAKGEFQLNDKTYHLPVNNGPNSLHGGIEGFSYKIFNYDIKEDSIVFDYLSRHGEEGYPGNLRLQATYQLLDKGLKIYYQASCDQDTIINITNHSYFNLSGHPCNIGHHLLQVDADEIGCIDNDGLFNGEIRSVVDTPFDFNTATLIKDKMYEEYDQLKIGKGYDHPFILKTNQDQVKLYYEETGIELTVSTSLPTAQIYSANYLSGTDKYGHAMKEKDAICIETQYIPDSINKEKNTLVILKKGEVYEEETSYTFKIK